MDICQFHSHSEASGNHQHQIINSTYVEDKNVHDVYEETSNCELRFITEEEMHDLLPPIGEYEELTTVKQLTTSCNNYCKLYKSFADTSINSPLENTDDQLFIEIVKEDINARHNPDENKSIRDLIRFNIEDHEEKVVKIKITNTDNSFSVRDSAKFASWKPPVIIPKSKRTVVIPKSKRTVIIPKSKRTLKERSPRKPLQLANYCDLITNAINSSPEKRMILTEIYEYIMKNVPFFKDIDKKGKDGWKNCVRHTLSVNKKFIRIKNTSKCRFSYWTVCEGGDFETQFAQYSWVSEIYKPEERKRKLIERNSLKSEQTSETLTESNKNEVQNTAYESINKKKNCKKYPSRTTNNKCSNLDKINNKTTNKSAKIIENQKAVMIKTKSKEGKLNKNKMSKSEIKPIRRNEPRKSRAIKKIEEKPKAQTKKYVNKKLATEMIKRKQHTRILRVLPERLSRKAESFFRNQETENVRRSNRKKSVRKSS